MKPEQLQKFYNMAEPRSKDAIRKAEERKKKKKDKDLLLKDLCARLPYGVTGSVENHTGTFVVKTVFNKGEYIDGYFKEFNRLRGYHVEEFKPYLRPMSSMTEEEKKEYQSLCEIHFDNDADANFLAYYFDTVESFDWLNKNMFDCRGLIEKDLAIGITEQHKSSNEEAANPESPFKVGDKVVINCREKFYTTYNGKEGTIIDIFDLEKSHWGNIVVEIDNGMRITFYASELIKK